MKLWEYKVVKGFMTRTDFMDELGEEGWELVQIVAATNENELDFFYFKRPIEDDEDYEDDDLKEE